MEIVFNYSERIAVMHEGKEIAEGRPEEVKKDKMTIKLITGDIFQ